MEKWGETLSIEYTTNKISFVLGNLYNSVVKKPLSDFFKKGENFFANLPKKRANKRV